MKKTVITGTIILITIVLLMLQLSIFNNLKLFNVKPNLFLILLTSLVVYTNKKTTYVFFILTGIILDLLLGGMIGITSISMLISSIIIMSFKNILTKKNMANFLLFILIVTIFYELVYNLIRIGLTNTSFDIYILKIIAIESIYNILISIIIYPIIEKIGNEIYPEYKKSNILTKYF